MLWYIVGTVLHSLILSELDLYNIVHVLYPKIKVHPGSAWLLVIIF